MVGIGRQRRKSPKPWTTGANPRNPSAPMETGGDAMKTRINTVLGLTLAVVMFVATASAQQTPSPPPTTPYGAPIGLDAAKKVMAAAEAEATKNNWTMAIIILDSTGHPVMLHKFDNTQYGSIACSRGHSVLCPQLRRLTHIVCCRICGALPGGRCCRE